MLCAIVPEWHVGTNNKDDVWHPLQRSGAHVNLLRSYSHFGQSTGRIFTSFVACGGTVTT